jgi:hypothetical protein
MTNTSKGEGSQHQTKRHIEKDSLLVQRMPELKFYPFSTTSREVVRFSVSWPIQGARAEQVTENHLRFR